MSRPTITVIQGQLWRLSSESKSFPTIKAAEQWIKEQTANSPHEYKRFRPSKNLIVFANRSDYRYEIHIY
jgi:hypothetical protein